MTQGRRHGFAGHLPSSDRDADAGVRLSTADQVRFIIVTGAEESKTPSKKVRHIFDRHCKKKTEQPGGMCGVVGNVPEGGNEAGATSHNTTHEAESNKPSRKLLLPCLKFCTTLATVEKLQLTNPQLKASAILQKTVLHESQSNSLWHPPTIPFNTLFRRRRNANNDNLHSIMLDRVHCTSSSHVPAELKTTGRPREVRHHDSDTVWNVSLVLATAEMANRAATWKYFSEDVHMGGSGA